MKEWPSFCHTGVVQALDKPPLWSVRTVLTLLFSEVAKWARVVVLGEAGQDDGGVVVLGEEGG